MPRLIPCLPPSAQELALLRPDRPVKITANYVHRFRDASGKVRFEYVTHEWAEARWYRVDDGA